MNTRQLRFASNHVRDIIALFRSELTPLYGSAEIDSFLFLLFEEFLGWNRVEQLLQRDQTINQSDLLRFHWALEDLRQFRPIQHIIGHVDFANCHINVNPNVLVPRPETEEMVTQLINSLHNPARILDLCTGSGCIAIALKKAFPRAEVTAIDLSPEALLVAQDNAAINHAEITFIQADVLSWETSRRGFDLIVSNPPYVLPSERVDMQPNVLNYEPVEALFVPGADPLCFHRAIARISTTALAPNGIVATEINEKLGVEVCSLFQEHHLHAELVYDFRGKPRWVKAQVSSSPEA